MLQVTYEYIFIKVLVLKGKGRGGVRKVEETEGGGEEGERDVRGRGVDRGSRE